MKKIMIYGFANYFEVLQYLMVEDNYFDWSVLTNNYQTKELAEKNYNQTKVRYLYEGFNEMFDKTFVDDLNEIIDNNLEKSFWHALDVDKVHYKKKSGEYQIRFGLTVYKMYKSILQELKPDAVLFPIIESQDGFILYNLCKELNIEPLVYAHGRNIGGSFFSDSYAEILPRYVKKLPDDEIAMKKAIDFCDKYYQKPFKLEYKDENMGEIYPLVTKKSTYERLRRNLYEMKNKEKHNLKINLWIKFLVKIQKLRMKYLKMKYQYQQRTFDFKSIDQIPDNMVYYPLQFSPESSINVPNPYYIDQLRVIDDIRYNILDNRILIIKEHPAMMGTRSKNYYETLKKIPGVYLADSKISSLELVKKADITVSVTGSACLEAFLMQKPIYQIGDNFLKPYLTDESTKKITKNQILNFVCDVNKVNGEFILYSPNAFGFSGKTLFSKSNIANMLENLKLHINRIEKYRMDEIKDDEATN